MNAPKRNKRKKKNRIKLQVGHGHKPISPQEKARYYAYLKSNQWREKREVALEMYGRVCGLCGSKHDLQVHHRTYKNIYKELMEDLMILCESCHSHHHKSQIWKNGKVSKYMKNPNYDTSPTTYYPNRSKERQNLHETVSESNSRISNQNTL